MEKKTKLWLGAGLVAVAGYLLLKSKKANTTPVVAAAPKQMVGFSSGEFFTPDNQKFMNASAEAMQVPASKEFFHTESMKFGVDGKWAKAEGSIFANQPFESAPKAAVSKKVMPFTSTQGDVVKNAIGDKFFKPETKKYGTNQGVFAPSVKASVMPAAVAQPAPKKMLVGVDATKVGATNKASMNFLTNPKVWA